MAVVPHPDYEVPSFRCGTLGARLARRLPCLRFTMSGYGDLIVEDTPAAREGALMMIFGEHYDEEPPAEKVIVSRCERTREELDALPEWEP